MIIGTSVRIPPHFFIKKSITTLEKNILILSEEQINNQLKEIYKLTQTEFFEIALLNKFLKHIQKKKLYYYHKQYALYDWSALPSVIIAFLLLLITLISYYYACIYYAWAEKNKLIAISIVMLIYIFI